MQVFLLILIITLAIVNSNNIAYTQYHYQKDPTQHVWYYVSENRLNFQEAQQACTRDVGGKLALPQSAGAMRFIWESGSTAMDNMYQAVGGWKGGFMFLDGNDIDVEGTWVDSSNQPVNFLDWNRAEPNNLGENEHGMATAKTIDIPLAEANMFDVPCEERLGYFCEATATVGEKGETFRCLDLCPVQGQRFNHSTLNRCAFTCFRDMSCRGFAYDKSTSMCVLSNGGVQFNTSYIPPQDYQCCYKY